MFPGRQSKWEGYDSFEFEANGESVLMVAPAEPAPGRPWIWRAEFFGHEPQADLTLLAKGWHVVHVPSAAGHYGSPVGVAGWDRAYSYLIQHCDFASAPVLEGFSRGGLLVYNWAIRHPQQVTAIYADAPVVNTRKWFARKYMEPVPVADWLRCLEEYGVTRETHGSFAGSPVDNLAPLAKAKVPLLHVVGDVDDVVPVAEHTAILEERYRALGGEINVIHKPDCNHHPHSLPDPAPIVEFILKAWRARIGSLGV